MLGIKQRLRYRDITWLMDAIDVSDVLDRLGVKHGGVHGEEVQGFCPDHHLFVDRSPSHMTWGCNVKTGLTYCFTEPRGSNLLWVATRLLETTPEEAIYFMTGRNSLDIKSTVIINKVRNLQGNSEKGVDSYESVYLDDIRSGITNRFISDACYDFFMNPPSKAPTLIGREAVDYYQVFERRWGYYSNRAVIPFFLKKELVGFCAVDLLGEKRWLLEHPLKSATDYRKTLYPLNFSASECLFGIDDCEQNASSIIITEGAREKMKLWQEGYPNSVACLKADLSPGQISLLCEKAPKEIILMFDGDVAGWSATEKNAKSLQSLFPVRQCLLPIGKDPKNLAYDDFKKLIKRGKLT